MKATAKKILTYGLTSIGALTLIFALTAAGGSFPVKLNAFITQLKQQTLAYNDYKPEDRVYMQLDKPFYKPGDDIWFSAYLREGRTLKKSGKSDVLHVELINPKGNVQKKIKLLAQDGFAKGDFHLDSETAGGIWKVKAYSKWQDNEKDPFFFEKEFQVQKVVLPNLKMKLDFDRKAYGPGDEVTASLDLQTNANQPLANHDFTYIGSLDGDALVKFSGKTDDQGKANLKLALPGKLTTNDGLVNVMISYDGLTESVSRAIPIVLNKIDLSFFPEGGDLVEGLPSRVAFKALNEFGKPADIEGVIIDGQGAEVGSFSSFHQGMGAFDFHPGEGHSYHAKITKPVGVTETYDLPSSMPRGYVLNVGKVDAKEMQVVVRSTENEAMSLVAQVRGEVYWASEVTVTGGKMKVNIPTSKFPMGVCQLTLFDSKGIERCERLAFVNRDKQLNVKIETNKEKYLPREKVKMTVKVTDERGMPMPAHLSVAVVNDQLISFADNKDGNIQSKLLLEPDLNTKVEEAKFYFDKNEKKSIAAMDYLMMTSGWRRFTWEEVLTDRLPTLTHQGERALVVGFVKDAYTGQPIPNAKVMATVSEISATTDKNGRYILEGLDLATDRTINVQAKNYTQQSQSLVDYNQNQTFALYSSQQAEIVELGAVRIQAEAMEVELDEVHAMAAPIQQMDVVVARAGKGRRKRAGNGLAKMKKANRPMAARNKDFAKMEEAAPVAEQPLVEGVEELLDDNFNADFADAEDMDGIEPKENRADEKQKGEPGMGDLANEIGGENTPAGGAFATGMVADHRMGKIMANDKNVQGQEPATYYRAREFAAPVYTGKDAEAPHTGRTDFRETVYWNPEVKVDRSGKAVLEFYCSDEISSFRATVEGIAVDGAVGHSEKVYFAQLPFNMQARVPVEVASNDHLTVPVTLKNNTDEAMSGSLHVMPPKGLKPVSTTGSLITIPAGTAKTINLEYEVLQHVGEEVFNIAFSSQGHTDAFEQKLKIVSAGFPVEMSFSGNESIASYPVDIRKTIPGSITASFTAFPSVVSDLVKGIESILREPYGCFEQTSTSSYPNAMVMSYMKEQDDVDPAIMKRSKDLLAKGYKRLTTFECSKNGYEWFGSNPPHEALTAYGLMQFNDYAEVYKGVDQKMVKRTADWLMKRRDGKGGFKRNPRALDGFGGADEDVTNSYITYALSEAGYDEIMPEAEAAFAKAMANKDPYQLALVANAMFNLDQPTKGHQAVAELVKTQNKEGGFIGKKGSITRSGGTSLKVETTSLAVLAMLASGKPDGNIVSKAVECIVKSRSGHGGFGSTQGTILGLKAMVAYSKYSAKTEAAGTIEIYVDGEKVAETAYEANRREPVSIEGLGAYLSEGKHIIEVKYPGVETPLPYSLAIDYNTSLPASSPECVVGLKTKLSATKVNMGETVRLSAKLTNLTEKGQPMTMAILGLPAGLSAQPWQLKEHQEKGVFDFYEIIGNNVVCYYRQMKPGERREINLDLKADIPGTYTAPASSAYLYYTAEHKDWVGTPAIEIVN